MLAGPKKKQKYSIVTQNLSWVNDESRFGTKMLEKMGWAKGKGLGANEDGIINPIKVQRKLDSRGVGFTPSHDRVWVAHQDNFSSLLSQLNSNVPVGNVEHKTIESSVVSLEEKSKVQKRVHYKKFTKGKDLSSYKAADMAAILGFQESQSLPTTPLSLSDAEDSSNTLSCPESNEKTSDKDRKTKRKRRKMELKSNALSNTITSEMNMSDYFKMRMEIYKKKTVANNQEKEQTYKTEVVNANSNNTSIEKTKESIGIEQKSLSKSSNQDNAVGIGVKRKSKKSKNKNKKRCKI